MIILKKLLIFLLICINKTNEFRTPHYSASVLGYFSCRYSRNGSATLLVSKNSIPAPDKKPIDKITVKYGLVSFFRVSIWSLKQPHLFLKIYHSCVNATDLCLHLKVLQIPTRFISRGKKSRVNFNLKNVELSHQNQQRTNICRGRRRSRAE